MAMQVIAKSIQAQRLGVLPATHPLHRPNSSQPRAPFDPRGLAALRRHGMHPGKLANMNSAQSSQAAGAGDPNPTSKPCPLWSAMRTAARLRGVHLSINHPCHGPKCIYMVLLCCIAWAQALAAAIAAVMLHTVGRGWRTGRRRMQGGGGARGARGPGNLRFGQPAVRVSISATKAIHFDHEVFWSMLTRMPMACKM